MKLLLHACCAPCSIQCVQALTEEGLRPDLCWYNPNIHPHTEYCSRRDALCSFAEENNLSLVIEDEYGLDSFTKAVSSLEEQPPSGGSTNTRQRCIYCYRLRLGKIAAMAAQKGFDAFSTTLLISPYQDHELLRQAGKEAAAPYGLQFLYRDFRPRFRQGQNQARQAGYYMQKYCGCIYSEQERRQTND